MLKSIQNRARSGSYLFKRCEIQHKKPAGLIQVWLSRCVVAGRDGCKKTILFSSYSISDAQETGRNRPYGPFMLGFFSLLEHSVLGLPVFSLCLETLKRNLLWHDYYLFCGTTIKSSKLIFLSEFGSKFYLCLFMGNCKA